MDKILDNLEFYNKICNDEQKLFMSIFDRYCRECNLTGERCKDLVTSYLIDEVREESIKSDFDNIKSPVLVCVVKDEKTRMEKFFDYYRKLGVSQFVIIDNESSDGTKQLCASQRDVNLFSVNTPYSSARRVGWINQILSKYGRNRWYLVVDADELIDYVESEAFSINDMIKVMDVREVYRVLGIQVDFYSKMKLFEMKDDSINWKECIFFDKDTYIEQESDKCVWFVGGSRKRILNTFSLLTKYPLFYYDNNTINISSHYLYPFEGNHNSECFLCIKHYEFLNQTDYAKMLDIIKKGNYASNSREYIEMFKELNKRKKTNFYESGISSEYITSKDLLNIKYMRDWIVC